MNTLNHLKECARTYQSLRDRYHNARSRTEAMWVELKDAAFSLANASCSYLDAKRERRKKENRRQAAKETP